MVLGPGGDHPRAEADVGAGAQPQPAPAVRRQLAQRDPAVPGAVQHHLRLWWAWFFIFLGYKKMCM